MRRLALAMVAVLAAEARAAPGEPRWDFDGARIELMLGFGPRVRPALYSLHLIDVAFVSPWRRVGLTVPFLVLELDDRRPTGNGNISYSALYAPVLFIASAELARKADSVPVTALVATLLWLEGGTVSWTPGGQGNIHRAGGKAASLSLVARNQLGLFADGPLHLRETLGLGLTLRVDERANEGSQWPKFVCGAGVFASAAWETSGGRSRERGVWLSCGLGFMPIE